MTRVQEWVSRRLETVHGCGCSLSPHDLTDALRSVRDDASWHACEQELMGHLLRVSDVHTPCVHMDTTTASSSANVNAQGLVHLGHSKDHRPDLPQRNSVLASLDPVDTPLATDVRSGEHADDPVPLPIIARVRDGLQQNGLLSVGECTLAALQIRASIQAHGDSSLCPLSAVQAPRALVHQDVEAQRAQGAPVVHGERMDEQGKSTGMAYG